LKTIAKESPLNALRVQKYGISLNEPENDFRLDGPEVRE
jgi:hypothetical protein